MIDLRGRLIDESTARVRDAAKTTFRHFHRDFSLYAADHTVYEDANGQVVAHGQAALETLLLSGTLVGPVFAKPQILLDGAFEGGGSKGLAYIGAAHALAHTGIWFQRVAGTSAGSLAAALIAAGYRIDLNYPLDVLAPPKSGSSVLTASPDNSINQILFEDNYQHHADFAQEDDPAFSSSWSAAFVNDVLDQVPFMSQYKDLEHTIMDTRLSVGDPARDAIRNKLNSDVPGLGTFLDPVVSIFTTMLEDNTNKLIDDIRQQFLSRFLVIQPSKWGEEFVESVVEASGKPLDVRRVRRAIYRILEEGGFWTGDVLKAWLERHLKARIPASSRTGPDGTVAFADLPIDLCVTAVDIGTVGTKVELTSDQLVYFSKKATPHYSVAEAVRRSVSLPVAFYPRTIAEGEGSNPPNLTQPFVVNHALVSELTRRRFQPVEPLRHFGAGGGAAPQFVVVDYKQHHNHLLLDGGMRVNLPVGVFRDPLNRFMGDNYDRSGQPQRYLVAFNLNELENAPERPDGVMPPGTPEPIGSLGRVAAEVFDFLGSLIPGSGGALPTPPGVAKLGLVATQTVDYAIGNRSEQEIVDLLGLVPKTILVDVFMRDPAVNNDDGRISGLDFAMPKLTKKWLARSSWQGVVRALTDLSTETGMSIGVPPSIDPYAHDLQVSNVSSTAYVVAPRAALGDTYFADAAFTLEKGQPGDLPGQNGSRGRYRGLGATWIKTLNADRNSAAPDLVRFTVNRPVRVMLVFDSQHSPLPGFVENDPAWINPGWTFHTTDPAIASAPVIPSVPGAPDPLIVRGKNFPAGQVVLPGPRSGGGAGNRCNYSVLVLAR